MIDRSINEAEELDFYVESHQAGQASQFQPDLPLGESRLAKKLLGISGIAQPDAQFLVKLEKQIHETARRPAETRLLKDNSHSTGQSKLSIGKNPLFSQPRKRRLSRIPLPAPITGILLRIFYAIM